MKKTVNNNAPPFVKITIKSDVINVLWGFTTFKINEDNGKISCYIPGFDFFFSASDQEMIDKKGRVMTKLFLDHFFIHNTRKSLKMLALELHKKGFKTDRDHHDMGQLIKNIAINANFKSASIKPADFENAESVYQEAEMEVA